MSDFGKIIEAGIVDLYLKMVEVYTESIASSVNMNVELKKFFNHAFLAATEFDLMEDENLKHPEFIEGEALGRFNIDFQSIPSEDSQVIVKTLIQQYDKYGISPPPNGFLQIDSGAKQWWKTKNVTQNGYFINVETINVDKAAKKVSYKGKDYSNSWPIEPNLLMQTPGLRAALIESTKNAYFQGLMEYSDEEQVAQLNKTDLMDSYFIILDENSNSFKFDASPNASTGKLYVRVFFNEYGQKLRASVIDISGVEDIKKIPSGIRKNYVIENLFSGIDAFEKYYTSEGEPSRRTQKTIDGLKTTKELLKKIIKDKKIAEDETVGFVFDEEYKFITVVDSNNKSISNQAIYSFLKDQIVLNKYISTLNSINCQLVGDAISKNTISIGSTPSNYKHFEANPKASTKKSKAKKVSNYKLSRSKLKFLGDVTLRAALAAASQTEAGQTIKTLYDVYFNKIDIEAMATSAAKSLAKQIAVPDLRKLYFQVFIESLDITELIDCVAEQAGKMEYKYETSAPAFDENGKLKYKKVDGNEVLETKTVVTEGSEETNFEYNIKLRLYLAYMTFYNAAKKYQPKLLNFPSGDPNDPGLPSPQNQLKFVANAQSMLSAPTSFLEQTKIEHDTAKSKGEVPKALKDKYQKAKDDLKQAQDQYVNALATLDDFIDKNFSYILMIPRSQTERIFSIITENEPQYKNNSSLLKPDKANNTIPGILDVRDDPYFTPENFVRILFAQTIMRYVNGLGDAYFRVVYDNIAKKNKKLKTTAQLAENKKKTGTGAGELGKSAKTNKAKLPKVINLNFKLPRRPVFDYQATFREALEMGEERVRLILLEKLLKTTADGAQKELSGDEDILNILPPSQYASAAANDPAQNITGGENSTLNSLDEIVAAAKKEIFTDSDESAIRCLFYRLSSEVPVQIQLKFILQAVSPGTTWSYTMQDIFSACGLPSDINIVNDFFIWLAETISEAGTLDSLFEQTITAAEIASNNADPCDDDGSYKDNLPTSDSVADQMLSNEARAARQQLYDMLSLLSDTQRNSLVQSAQRVPCPDTIGPVRKNALDRTVKSTLNSINKTFNSEIRKFKPIILKMDNAADYNFLQSITGLDLEGAPTDEEVDGSPYGKFKQTNAKKDSGAAVDAEAMKNDFESGELSLKTVIQDVVESSGLFSDTNDSSFGTAGVAPFGELQVFKFYASDFITMRLVFSKPENDPQEFGEVMILPDSTNVIIHSSQIVGEIPKGTLWPLPGQSAKIAPYQDIPGAASELINLDPGDSEYAGYLAQIKFTYWAKYGFQISEYTDGFIGSKLHKAIGGDTSGNIPPEVTDFAILSIDAVLRGLLRRFLDAFMLFDTKKFMNIPLLDKEAKYLNKVEPKLVPYNNEYEDGGLLGREELFAKYQNQRTSFQCFISQDGETDSHQVSQLMSLYQALFNVCIVEDLLNAFFSLNITSGNLELLNNTAIQADLVGRIKNSFLQSVSQIGSLQDDYISDLKMLYKYDLMDNPTEDNEIKLAAAENETLDNVLVYFVKKYYSSALNKVRNRIRVALGNDYTFSEDENVKSAVLNPAPNGTFVWPLYDNGSDAIDSNTDAALFVPNLTGIHEGLMIQEYIDIKQNGTLMKDHPGESDGDKDVWKVLPVLAKISIDNEDKGTIPVDYDIIKAMAGLEGAPKVETVGKAVYTDLFFRSKRYEKEELFGDEVVTAGEDLDAGFHLNPGGVTKTTFSTHTGKSNVPVNYFEDFKHTQGKISFEDFNTHHYARYQLDKSGDGGAAPGILGDSPVKRFASLLNQNGPKTYYDKAAAGMRLCLVLKEKDNFGFAEKLTQMQVQAMWGDEDFYTPSADDNGNWGDLRAKTWGPNFRFIAKEKIIKYKNPETKEVFVVIPLITREIDVLEIAESTWTSDIISDSKPVPWLDNLMNILVLASAELKAPNVVPNTPDLLLNRFFEAYKPQFFEDIVPIAMREILEDQYSDKINALFGGTKQQIVTQIRILKMSMSKEWETDLSEMVNSDASQDELEAMYTIIALSVLGVLIKAGATLGDPTWKTPWFFPGPATPLGFLAKILP